MEIKNKLLGMIGLARKAGEITVGSDLVCLDMKSGKAKLIILANDASDNTKKKIISKSNFYKVRCLQPDLSGDEISKAVGKGNTVAAIAVRDKSFSSAIENMTVSKL